MLGTPSLPQCLPKTQSLATNGLIRQRRRQQWHSFKVAKKHVKTEKRKDTVDSGVFPEPLRAPRRAIPIQDKLKVLDYYEALLKEKAKNIELAKIPRPVGMGRAALGAWRSQRKKCLNKARRGIERLCRERYPDIVQKTKIIKWYRACAREGWRDLPEVVRTRTVATTNAWRASRNIPEKGRKRGGRIPLRLQKELDHLMIECTSGTSKVSERKELVTVEQVDSWIACRITSKNMQCCCSMLVCTCVVAPLSYIMFRLGTVFAVCFAGIYNANTYQ